MNVYCYALAFTNSDRQLIVLQIYNKKRITYKLDEIKLF